MPKLAFKTDAQIEALNAKPGQVRRVAVGPQSCAGLHLRIEGKNKLWVLRVKVGEKRRDVHVGRYPGKEDMKRWDADTLKKLGYLLPDEARIIAAELRAQYFGTGEVISPTVAKKQRDAVQQAQKLIPTKGKTFKECSEDYLAENLKSFKNDKHKQQWQNTLATYAYPMLDMAVADVTLDDIEKVLKQPVGKDSLDFWSAKNETASRVRGRIEKVLDYAKVKKLRTGDNPAIFKGALELLVGKRTRLQRGHHAALPHAQIGVFMEKLHADQPTLSNHQPEDLSGWALEFLILTMARSGEVRAATWNEIDLPGNVWTIPAARMKAGKEHRVPLSAVAVALLEKMQGIPRIEGSNLVFPALRGGVLPDMTFRPVIERLGFKVTPHGFRSTAREWAGEKTDCPREVVEHALAHLLPDKAEAAYQRGTLFDKRRAFMNAWSKRCSQKDDLGNKFVSIGFDQ